MKISKFHALGAVVAACAVFVPTVAGAKTIELEPSSRWQLDYSEDSCALRRLFGQGDQQAQIEIRQFAPLDTMQMAIASNITTIRKKPFLYRFTPAEDWQEYDAKFFFQYDPGFAGAIITGGLTGPMKVVESDPKDSDHDDKEPSLAVKQVKHAASLEFADQITGVEVDKLFRHILLLKTGSLKAPLVAMDACLDNLVSHWGLDPKVQANLTRAPEPINIDKVARMVSYPPKMLKAGMPGLVNVRLEINELGGVTGCHIQTPLSDPAFEEASCADIENDLEFEPALDKDGKPIASYWITRVMFTMSG